MALYSRCTWYQDKTKCATSTDKHTTVYTNGTGTQKSPLQSLSGGPLTAGGNFDFRGRSFYIYKYCSCVVLYYCITLRPAVLFLTVLFVAQRRNRKQAKCVLRVARGQERAGNQTHEKRLIDFLSLHIFLSFIVSTCSPDGVMRYEMDIGSDIAALIEPGTRPKLRGGSTSLNQRTNPSLLTTRPPSQVMIKFFEPRLRPSLDSNTPLHRRKILAAQRKLSTHGVT